MHFTTICIRLIYPPRPSGGKGGRGEEGGGGRERERKKRGGKARGRWIGRKEGLDKEGKGDIKERRKEGRM